MGASSRLLSLEATRADVGSPAQTSLRLVSSIEDVRSRPQRGLCFSFGGGCLNGVAKVWDLVRLVHRHPHQGLQRVDHQRLDLRAGQVAVPPQGGGHPPGGESQCDAQLVCSTGRRSGTGERPETPIRGIAGRQGRASR